MILNQGEVNKAQTAGANSYKSLDSRSSFLHHSMLIDTQVSPVFGIRKLNIIFWRTVLGMFLFMSPTAPVFAGGGLVLEDDVCIIRIDFYSAHFTAYQPNTSGNEQFCQDLPATGETIFVLDYLHQSLKEVPVDFRIIRDVTGQGRFVKLKHIEEIEDIEQHTVFYQAPVIRQDASFKVEHEFREEGAYIGIVSAGHPSTDMIYTAVFPFEVGGSYSAYLPALLLLLAGALLFSVHRFVRSRRVAAEQGMAP